MIHQGVSPTLALDIGTQDVGGDRAVLGAATPQGPASRVMLAPFNKVQPLSSLSKGLGISALQEGGRKGGRPWCLGTLRW